MRSPQQQPEAISCCCEVKPKREEQKQRLLSAIKGIKKKELPQYKRTSPRKKKEKLGEMSQHRPETGESRFLKLEIETFNTEIVRQKLRLRVKIFAIFHFRA